MAVIGPRMAVDLAIPTGLDAGRILAFQMRSGKTAQEIIAESAAAVGVVNEAIAARWGRVTYITPLNYSIVAQGQGARKTPVKVEGKQADPVRSDIIGNMLPLKDYEDANGWTPIYLRDAWDAQITADLQVITDSWWTRVDTDILTRIFSNVENPIGTAGYDVPWAIGTGTNVNYIPPQRGTQAFDSTHTHFKTQSGTFNAANAKLLLEALVKDLAHHGITDRLAAMVSFADVAIYAGITGNFVKYVPAGINVVAGSTSAPVYVSPGELSGMPGTLFGLYLSDAGPVVELWSHDSIPTTYAWMTKPYGPNNPKNGIAIREHPAVGFGLRADPQLTTSIMPELDKVLFKATHGIGVNDRLNGVVGQGNQAGSYSAPSF